MPAGIRTVFGEGDLQAEAETWQRLLGQFFEEEEADVEEAGGAPTKEENKQRLKAKQHGQALDNQLRAATGEGLAAFQGTLGAGPSDYLTSSWKTLV
eukprot:2102166-Prorocentrum_lima.AAC.1